jgi:hypothetical protein
MERTERTFENCDHRVFRKTTEADPKQCPFCKNERRKRGEA